MDVMEGQQRDPLPGWTIRETPSFFGIALPALFLVLFISGMIFTAFILDSMARTLAGTKTRIRRSYQRVMYMKKQSTFVIKRSLRFGGSVNVR